MKKFFSKSLVVAAFAMAGLASQAMATVITFENSDAQGIVGSVNYAAIPIITQGFTFSSNMDVIDITTPDSWSGTGPAHSGLFATLNDSGGAMTMMAVGGGTFELGDLWYSPWFGYGIGGQGTLIGYLNGQIVDSVSFNVASGWNDVVANFASVDSVVFTTGSFFLVDDIAVNGGNQVPEPESLALFGLALAALGFARRKAKKA